MKIKTDLLINVKTFGAKGDGRTDDTRAIQEALTAAAGHTLTAPDTRDIPYVNGIPSRCGYHFHSTGPEVFFPAGHYLITKPLCPESVDTLRGEGHAWIEQKNPEKDIFYSEKAIRQMFYGLTLKGGRSHLNLGNSNEDNGFVLVENCKFYSGKGAAIQMRKNSNSTLLIIRQCQVVACEQVVVSYTDHTHMRDCWLTAGRSGDGAVIVTRADSFFTMDNICGVPLVNGYDQRWIDNYGTLICRNCRFGGEEAGFTPVVNFAKYWPQANASMVVLDGCWLVAALGNNKRKCAVYFEEIPNRVDIRNCNLIGIPPALVSDKIDGHDYFRARRGMLRYTIEDNVGEFSADIPDILRHPRINKMKSVKALSERETRTALKRARQLWKKMSRGGPKVESCFKAHQRRSRPGEYKDLSPVRYRWDTDDCMDGTSEKCSHYLVITRLDDQAIVVRKVEGGQGWPHVRIRAVEIDLERFPYLSWSLQSNDSPASLTVKVIDKESGRAVLLGDGNVQPFSYKAYNLKEACKVEGRRAFDILLYIGGHMFKGPEGSRRKEDVVKARPGDFVVFRFLRMEMA